jgi:hypothetical protein
LSLTLKEEHRLRVFENRVLRRIYEPKRDEVTGEWRKAHNKELHDVANRLLASPRKSLRVLSQEVGLSRSTCQRSAKKAGLHAYRFTVVQELKQPARLR